MEHSEVQALIDRAAKVIEKVKKNEVENVILDYAIDTITDIRSGENIGIAVHLDLSPEHGYHGIFFDALVRKFKAEDYEISLLYDCYRVAFRIGGPAKADSNFKKIQAAGQENMAMKIKEKIDCLVSILDKQGPNPLGSIPQCLAAAQIEALNCIKDFIDEKEAEL